MSYYNVIDYITLYYITLQDAKYISLNNYCRNVANCCLIQFSIMLLF